MIIGGIFRFSRPAIRRIEVEIFLPGQKTKGQEAR